MGDRVLERKCFKLDKNFNRQKFMHPKAQEVMAFMYQTALDEGVKDPCITETVTLDEEDKALKRVSKSHSTCRAWDFRTWNMTEAQRIAVTNKTNEKYGHLGAITSSGQRVLIVYHDNGNGQHLHCQLDSTYSLKPVGMK